MKNLFVSVLAGAGLVSLGGMANAVQYSWNLNSNAGNSHSMTFTSIPGGGPTLTVTAFRSGSTTDASGKLIDANVNPHGSGGLGVASSGESSSSDDYHMLDNKDGFDVLVFDSTVTGFDWGSIKIGDILTGYGIDSTPGMTYWAGGDYITNGAEDATYGFNKLCLTGTCTGGTTLAAAGFSTKSLTGLSTGGPGALSTSAQGRYLVVSGALDGGAGGGYDKFKISTVPTPQTVSLVGIGFVAMLLGMRRRRQADGSERGVQPTVA